MSEKDVKEEVERFVTEHAGEVGDEFTHRTSVIAAAISQRVPVTMEDVSEVLDELEQSGTYRLSRDGKYITVKRVG